MLSGCGNVSNYRAGQQEGLEKNQQFPVLQTISFLSMERTFTLSPEIANAL
jgi:hypothetical protein